MITNLPHRIRRYCHAKFGGRHHDTIIQLFGAGQFEALVELYQKHRPYLLPDERAGQYLVRSLIYLQLQGTHVDLDLPPHLAQWRAMLSARVKGETAEANALFEQVIVDADQAHTFIKRFFLGNYFGLTVQDETLHACLERLSFDDVPQHLGLAGRKQKMPFTSLFVSGVPRSGTTALGSLLNTSPDIELYHELYPARVGYTAQMFDPNLLPSLVQARYDEAKRPRLSDRPDLPFRGDKRPLFLNSWAITRRNYTPDEIRIVHIVRYPRNVAASYEKRRRRALTGKRNRDADRGPWLAESDLQVNRQMLERALQGEFAGSIRVVPFRKALCDLDTIREMHDFIGARLDIDAANTSIQRSLTFLERAKVEQAPLTFLSQDDIAWYDAHAT